MFFGIIGMLILYVLLKYILAWIRYFNSQHERLGQSTWRWSYDYEVDGDFVESQAFAYISVRSFLNLPISFPETTGVKKPCLGGEIINFKE